MFGRVIAAWLLLLGPISLAWGQLEEFPAIKGFAASKPAAVTHKLVSDVKTISAGKPFKVGIAFDVKDGSYFYYKTAGSLGLPTKIDLRVPEGFAVGPLQFPAPEIKHDELDKPVIYYVYPRSTIIFAEVTPPADLPAGQSIEVTASVSYQYCDDTNCTPVTDRGLTLTLESADGAPTSSESAKIFARAARQVPRSDGAIVGVNPFLSVDALRPNDQAKLALEIDIAPGYHIQMHRPPDTSLISTEVVLDVPDGIDFTPPVFPEPLKPTHPLQGLEDVREYRERVTVIVPIRARKFVQPGELSLKGFIRYQACDANGCQPPAFAEFSLVVPVMAENAKVSPANEAIFAAAANDSTGGSEREGLPSANVAAPRAPEVAAGGSVATRSVKRDEHLGDSLARYLLYAFLGGLILNVMPCVLPVIAIKVLGFVNQAGESRSQILLLNLAYSAGVIGVFLALATLAAFAGFGWGQLFQSAEFNLAMASIVFAMGLSLLGVFEIPVPGFAGSVDPTKKEGPLGAMLTGVLATLLATPCSGPFMGVTLTWSVRQPPIIIYAVWGMMGIGMAFPYILCGIFPQAIRWIPKPGMWMVRFKELAGFVLLGTVVYIISFLNSVYVLPLLVILLGITIAIWMVSNLYDYRSTKWQKLRVRTMAVGMLALAMAAGLLYFKPLAEARARADFERMLAETGGKVTVPEGESDGEIAWVPFTEAAMNQLVAEGKTVFIDFTADWCLICKANEVTAIETKKIRSLMEQYGVVPMKADWTDRSDEIKTWLHKFDGASVPHYVLIPAQSSDKVIVFDGSLTESKVEQKIREAGPSKGIELMAPANRLSMSR